MTQARQIAFASTYDEFVDALRHRATELKVTRERIDAISGLPDGYTSKLLCIPPMKSLGRASLGPMLEVLGLTIVLIENPKALARYSKQFSKSKYPTRASGTLDLISYQISRRKLKRMARRGGKRRAEKLSAAQLSRIGRKAGKASARKRALKRAAAKVLLIAAPEPCANPDQPI
jgi:hypothetical protein